MQNSLIQHFTKRIHLSEEEINTIHSFFEIRTYPKKTTLLCEGEICKTMSYIKTGCTRVYAIDANGLENNIFFSLEDWWTVDLKSFIEQSPARFYIQTLEACELCQISKLKLDELLERVPKLEKWLRVLFQNALISSENRINYKTSLKATERYLRFLEKYPTLEGRIPQRQIASYLGVSSEFLSSMKSRMLKNQKA